MQERIAKEEKIQANKDYSGLTGLSVRIFKLEDETVLDEDRIGEFVEEFETHAGANKIADLWGAVGNATSFSLDYLNKCGIIKK